MHALRSACPVVVPFDHGRLMRDAVYHILGATDSLYVDWLKRTGYCVGSGSSLQMFCTSPLRVAKEQRAFRDGKLVLHADPCSITWEVTSPALYFLEVFREGLKLVRHIPVSELCLDIVHSRPLPKVAWTGEQHFICLSPMIRLAMNEKGEAHYLHPLECCAWNAFVQADLAQKYRVIHGTEPRPCALKIVWDKGYLARDHRGGKKRVRLDPEPPRYHNEASGCQAPFTLRTAPELIQVAYQCGIGEFNHLGLGMVNPLW